MKIYVLCEYCSVKDMWFPLDVCVRDHEYLDCEAFVEDWKRKNNREGQFRLEPYGSLETAPTIYVFVDGVLSGYVRGQMFTFLTNCPKVFDVLFDWFSNFEWDFSKTDSVFLKTE